MVDASLPSIEQLRRPGGRADSFADLREWIRAQGKGDALAAALSVLDFEHLHAIAEFLWQESQAGVRAGRAKELLAVLNEIPSFAPTVKKVQEQDGLSFAPTVTKVQEQEGTAEPLTKAEPLPQAATTKEALSVLQQLLGEEKAKVAATTHAEPATTHAAPATTHAAPAAPVLYVTEEKTKEQYERRVMMMTVVSGIVPLISVTFLLLKTGAISLYIKSAVLVLTIGALLLLGVVYGAHLVKDHHTKGYYFCSGVVSIVHVLLLVLYASLVYASLVYFWDCGFSLCEPDTAFQEPQRSEMMLECYAKGFWDNYKEKHTGIQQYPNQCIWGHFVVLCDNKLATETWKFGAPTSATFLKKCMIDDRLYHGVSMLGSTFWTAVLLFFALLHCAMLVVGFCGCRAGHKARHLVEVEMALLRPTP